MTAGENGLRFGSPLSPSFHRREGGEAEDKSCLDSSHSLPFCCCSAAQDCNPINADQTECRGKKLPIIFATAAINQISEIVR